MSNWEIVACSFVAVLLVTIVVMINGPTLAVAIFAVVVAAITSTVMGLLIRYLDGRSR